MEKTSQGFVVVIDDDPQMRSLLIDHLELSNYNVKSFGDSLEAMQFLMGSSIEAQQVELVLTDLLFCVLRTLIKNHVNNSK